VSGCIIDRGRLPLTKCHTAFIQALQPFLMKEKSHSKLFN
jgi:hypothetical protein